MVSSSRLQWCHTVVIHFGFGIACYSDGSVKVTESCLKVIYLCSTVVLLLSLSYIPSYMHVHPGYSKKSANLQGTHKVHLRFYNKMSRSYSPCNENLHAHFLCLHAGYLQMHPCLKGNLRET